MATNSVYWPWRAFACRSWNSLPRRPVPWATTLWSRTSSSTVRELDFAPELVHLASCFLPLVTILLFTVGVSPAGRRGPVAPFGPAGPFGPSGPVAPSLPLAPAGPVLPSGPAGPAGPAGP